MKSSLNREFAARHLFVAILMAVLCLWFGYDGFVAYPSTPAAELYEKIEGAPAPQGLDLEAFKEQKTKTQYGFAALAFLASAVVGLRLLASARFRFEFDDGGFSVGGERFAYADVKSVDDRDWEKKGISRLDLGGRKVVLDAWHHAGVKEFHSRIASAERP